MPDLNDFLHWKTAQIAKLHEILGGYESVIRRAFPTATRNGSQDREDEIIAGLLPETTGNYLDIGAGEPVEASNTFQLFCRGWRGVLVEPLPKHWHALLRQRPGDHLLPFAASNVNGISKMRFCGTVSSMRPDWPLDQQTELMVETATVDTLLIPFPWLREKCDLLSIDVEGHEKQVLDGIDWNTFKPRFICIEYRKYHPTEKGEDLTAEWEPKLTSNKYEFVEQTEFNKIYRRK